MPSPRVLHLATSLGGGAGIATRRIVQAQIDYGMNSRLSAVNQSGAKLANHEKIIERSELAKLTSKSLTLIQTKVMQKSDLLVTPFSANTVKNWQTVIGDAEIIHIHAFYNLLNVGLLSQLSELAPIVVTLHDQRFFTGGCHYSGDCEGYKLNCAQCPQLRSAFKNITSQQLATSVGTLSKILKLKIISPSRWLANIAKGSAALTGHSVDVISNPVPEIFKPGMNTNLGIGSPLRIGFISENLNNPYKGLSVLIAALENLPTSFQAEIKFIGTGSIPQVNRNFRTSKEHLETPNDIANAIRTCDVVVVPSLQDNSPSVISESLMCGIPVIGSRVGGITEIMDEFNLPSFEKSDSRKLSKILAKFDKTQQAQLDHEKVRKKFSAESSALKHEEVYKEILT
jgi:glycosyltransferase involved in cell wall biosynthesis